MKISKWLKSLCVTYDDPLTELAFLSGFKCAIEAVEKREAEYGWLSIATAPEDETWRCFRDGVGREFYKAAWCRELNGWWDETGKKRFPSDWYKIDEESE